MRILITNDDGVYAPGLAALYESLRREHQVVIVAPETEQSAVGHAITLSDPIRVRPLGPPEGYVGWAVGGTPADCVKLALSEILDFTPDLVASGINKGSNTGFNILYSGTVSAASEAALQGVPSMAVSLDSHDPKADFSYAGWVACRIAELLPGWGLPPTVPVNVNVPALPAADIRGIRFTTQSQARFTERFLPRTDPRGKTYYWQAGETAGDISEEMADHTTLQAGYVSVTPLQLDLTHHRIVESFRNLDVRL